MDFNNKLKPIVKKQLSEREYDSLLDHFLAQTELPPYNYVSAPYGTYNADLFNEIGEEHEIDENELEQFITMFNSKKHDPKELKARAKNAITSLLGEEDEEEEDE